MRLFLLVAALSLAPGVSDAQGTGTVLVPNPEDPTSRVGTRGANFLEIGVGARALSLAGAYTSLAEGVTALYWNPAGIAEIESATAGFSLANLYEGLDITHSFVGGALPMGSAGAIGITLTQFSSGDIERTTEAFPEGNDPSVGATYSYVGTAAGLYYGRRLTDRLGLGIGVKFVTEGIDNAKANYVGIDLGTKFRTGLYGTHIAASLSNLGTSGRFSGSAVERFSFDEFRPGATPVELSTQDLQMPTLFRFSVRSDVLGTSDALLGVSAQHRVVALFDAMDAIDTDVRLAIAAEYTFREIVFLRAGKRWANEAQTDFQSSSFGTSVGGGLKLPLGATRTLAFDYAYTNMGTLDNIQVFSLEFTF